MVLINPEILTNSDISSLASWADQRNMDPVDLIEELKDVKFVKAHAKINHELSSFELPNSS